MPQHSRNSDGVVENLGDSDELDEHLGPSDGCINTQWVLMGSFDIHGSLMG